MRVSVRMLLLAILPVIPVGWAQSSPVINLVANAEGERATIAPNTWVEVKGSNLAPAGDSRVWQASDFVNTQMPTKLDGVGVTVNGKSAYVYYISPAQVNILTPPDALPPSVVVQVTNNGLSSPAFTVSAQPVSPSFFVATAPYVLAQHTADEILALEVFQVLVLLDGVEDAGGDAHIAANDLAIFEHHLETGIKQNFVPIGVIDDVIGDVPVGPRIGIARALHEDAFGRRMSQRQFPGDGIGTGLGIVSPHGRYQRKNNQKSCNRQSA